MSSFTAGGQHVFDWGVSQAHGTTAVIYHRGTWWTAAAGSGPGGRAGALGCVKGIDIVLNGGAGNGWPAVIRAQLACGAYKVADRQVIDGINTIKITGGGGRFTFWVNPATYLPVRPAWGSARPASAGSRLPRPAWPS